MQRVMGHLSAIVAALFTVPAFATTIWGSGTPAGEDYAYALSFDLASGAVQKAVPLFQGDPNQGAVTGRNFDIAFAPDGSLWGAGIPAGEDFAYALKFDPMSGAVIKAVPLFQGDPNFGAAPGRLFDIAFAPDGSLWGAGIPEGEDFAQVLNFDLTTGAVLKAVSLFQGDPSFGAAAGRRYDIAFAPDGSLWGSGIPEGEDFAQALKFDLATGAVLKSVPLFQGDPNFGAATGRLYDIAFASDGSLWGAGIPEGEDFAQALKFDLTSGGVLEAVSLFEGDPNLGAASGRLYSIAFAPEISAPGAVPEPETWLTMISGMILIASLLRSEKRSSTALDCTT